MQYHHVMLEVAALRQPVAGRPMLAAMTLCKQLLTALCVFAQQEKLGLDTNRQLLYSAATP